MDFYNNAEIYKKSYEQALKNNESIINQIKNFKEELEGVRTNLEENEKHLCQNVMVPIGSKSMMRGKLVHTNEVYVNLGDRWFVKTSAKRALEICGRMIARCDQNLQEFEKESQLLTSNLEIPDKVEIFPNENLKDIIEPYDEEYEARWKEEHRERVRKHKRQETEKRLTDEKLFEKLNQLEIEEARESSAKENKPISFNEKIKKQVSFSEEDLVEYQSTDRLYDIEESSIIRFEHSERIPESHENRTSDELISPSDIYRQYANQLPLKSILKHTNSKIYVEEEPLREEIDYFHDREPELCKTINVLGDIVERTPSYPDKSTAETRPTSKFKSQKRDS